MASKDDQKTKTATSEGLSTPAIIAIVLSLVIIIAAIGFYFYKNKGGSGSGNATGTPALSGNNAVAGMPSMTNVSAGVPRVNAGNGGGSTNAGRVGPSV